MNEDNNQKMVRFSFVYKITVKLAYSMKYKAGYPPTLFAMVDIVSYSCYYRLSTQQAQIQFQLLAVF